MNKLHYTVEKETYDDGTPNGIKTIRVYNKQMELVAELECFSDDLGECLYSDWEEIQQYLDDNGYGDENNAWSWNGDLDKPTVRPSVRTKYHNGKEMTEIHYWLNDGVCDCLSDCKDGNAGKKLELETVSF